MLEMICYRGKATRCVSEGEPKLVLVFHLHPLVFPSYPTSVHALNHSRVGSSTGKSSTKYILDASVVEYENIAQVEAPCAAGTYLRLLRFVPLFTVLSQIPVVAELIDKLADTPIDDLPDVLAQIDHWRWPRSDLNAWIKVLNKFDSIMEDIIRDYEIEKVQLIPFTIFHKRLLCEILRFERLLLENSTNRKTYNSYDVSIRISSFGSRPDILRSG